jgi:hypothetical protein
LIYVDGVWLKSECVIFDLLDKTGKSSSVGRMLASIRRVATILVLPSLAGAIS